MLIHFYSVTTKLTGFEMSFIQEASYVKLTMIVSSCHLLTRCDLSFDNKQRSYTESCRAQQSNAPF